MKIGFIGLGRMGANMVENLLDHKHIVVGYNRHPQPTKELSKKGMIPAYSLKEFITQLPTQKIIWLMIPAGKPVDDALKELIPLLKKDDIIIDGGNSYFKDSIRHAKEVKKKGLHFIDCGTSGGISGARHGACMMIGGDKKTFKRIEPLFKSMCVKNGYAYMGKSGAGHFAKMVHNAIEYGMMGAIAEGMETIKKSPFDIDLKEASKAYAHGSIIESRLMSWLNEAFQRKGYLESIHGEVPKGETEEEMEKLEKMTTMPLLHQARLMRVKTRKQASYSGKLIAAMRQQFGGHRVNINNRKVRNK